MNCQYLPPHMRGQDKPLAVGSFAALDALTDNVLETTASEEPSLLDHAIPESDDLAFGVLTERVNAANGTSAPLNDASTSNESQLPTSMECPTIDCSSPKPNDGHDSSTFPSPITFNIGGRMFVTTPSTLESESGLFRRQLFGAFFWRPSPDGSYFLDADPGLFDHLLRYMRRPNVFPLFYDKAKGFDYDLYNRLEVEANYFQIEELREWIAEKKYLAAVEIRHEDTYMWDFNDLAAGKLRGTVTMNMAEERHCVPRTKKVHLCPRGIIVHRGAPEKCGQACNRAQDGEPKVYEDEHHVDVVVMRKQIVFTADQCRSIDSISITDK